MMHYIPYHPICSKMHENTWQMNNCTMSSPHNWIYYLLLVILVSVFFIKMMYYIPYYPYCSKMHENTEGHLVDEAKHTLPSFGNGNLSTLYCSYYLRSYYPTTLLEILIASYSVLYSLEIIFKIIQNAKK